MVSYNYWTWRWIRFRTLVDVSGAQLQVAGHLSVDRREYKIVRLDYDWVNIAQYCTVQEMP